MGRRSVLQHNSIHAHACDNTMHAVCTKLMCDMYLAAQGMQDAQGQQTAKGATSRQQVVQEHQHEMQVGTTTALMRMSVQPCQCYACCVFTINV